MASPITIDEPDANISWVASRPGTGCPSPFSQEVGNVIPIASMPDTTKQTNANIDPVAWKRLIVNSLGITSAAPAAGTHAVAYTSTIVASGGRAPYTWSVSAGTLPSALTLDPETGVLAGTVAAAGTTAFTVKVVDKTGQSATKAISLVMA